MKPTSPGALHRQLLARLAVVACAASSAPGLLAQSFDPCGGDCPSSQVACGAEVAGELSASDCKQEGRFFDLYEWIPEGTGDAEVLVHATGFTPRLIYAFPPGQFPCRLVLEGTDTCAPGDPGVRCFQVPFLGGGRRLIQVTSVEEGAQGNYSLELHCAPQRCSSTCVKGQVDCGGSVAGTLEESDCATVSGGRLHSWERKVETRSRLRVTVDASAPVQLGLHYDAFFGRPGCNQLFTAPPCQKGVCLDAVVDAASYHLVVSGAERTSYRIDVACEPFEPCSACPIAGEIACGEKKMGQIGPGDCGFLSAGESGGTLLRWQRWSLDVPEPGFYQIRTDAGERAPSWSVRNLADCTPASIVESEPCGDEASPHINCQVVRLERGQYFIEVVVGGNPSSLPALDYTLEVQCLDLGPCDRCRSGSLACDTPYVGTLLPADCTREDGGALQALLLELPPPDVTDVTIRVAGNGFRASATLVDRFCKPIATGEACSAAEPERVCLTARLNPQGFRSKVYLLVSADPSVSVPATFDVMVECRPFTVCDPACLRGTVNVGEEKSGVLDARSCSADGAVFSDAWTLELAEPTLLDLLVTAEGFSPVVSVRDPDCRIAAFSNPLPGGYARIIRQLEPGTYTLVVENDAATPGVGGPYRLRLRARGCDLLACPQPQDLACAPNGKVAGKLEVGDCADAEGFLHDFYRLEVPALRRFSLHSSMASAPYFWIFAEGCKRRISFVATPNGALSFYLEKGVYTAVVTNITPAQGGDYTFGLSCEETSYCRDECLAGALVCGVTARGSLGTKDCTERSSSVDTWRFDVPPGAGDSTIQIDTPPGTSVFFSIFPESCEQEVNAVERCQRGPPGSPWSCALEPGAYRLAIYLDSVRLRQPLDYAVTFSMSAGCEQKFGFVPGDCTGDGKVDLADAVCVLGYLFRGELTAFPCAVETPFDPGPGDIALLDWDGNETLNLTDPIRLLGWLFQGGPPHILGNECTELPGCPPAPCLAR